MIPDQHLKRILKMRHSADRSALDSGEPGKVLLCTKLPHNVKKVGGKMSIVIRERVRRIGEGGCFGV